MFGGMAETYFTSSCSFCCLMSSVAFAERSWFPSTDGNTTWLSPSRVTTILLDCYAGTSRKLRKGQLVDSKVASSVLFFRKHSCPQDRKEGRMQLYMLVTSEIASRLIRSFSCIAAANQGGGKGGQTNNQAAQAIAQKAAINQAQAGEG
jgi:hypothetical protein